MPKYALFTTILLLTTSAVSMAWEADFPDSNIILSDSTLSELSDVDFAAVQTDFRGQSAYQYPPEEY